MVKRRASFAISKIAARAGLHQRPRASDMARPAIAEDHRLDQGGPSEIVHMVERRTRRDQPAHHLVMAEMRGGNERRAEIGAGDLLRFPPSLMAALMTSGASATAAMVMAS